VTRTQNILAVAALAALCGCFAADADAPLDATTGDLSVTLAGPPGIPTKLNITGPKAFKGSLTESGKLLQLLPGDYVFTPVPVVLQTSVVDTVYTADVGTDPVMVHTGKTTEVSFSFAVRPGSGSLWATAFGDPRFLQAWDGNDLLRGGGPNASTFLKNVWEQVLSLAFDGGGNLWLLTSAGGATQLSIVPWRDLAKDDGTAEVTNIPLGRGLSSFAFDGSGGIWAASPQTNTVVRYTADQLASADTLEPAVTLRANGQSLNAPTIVFFDGAGNLWVANDADTSNLVRYSPRQIAATGYPIPLVTLSAPRPSAVAFDASGNLWVASGSRVYQVGASSQGTSGAVTAKIVLDLKGLVASSVAFDALGDLWVTGVAADGSGQLAMLAAGQLAASGAPKTFVPLSSTVAIPAGRIAFNPSPTGLPVAGP
jgi:ligand-binding sensor domain-containing protein